MRTLLKYDLYTTTLQPRYSIPPTTIALIHSLICLNHFTPKLAVQEKLMTEIKNNCKSSYSRIKCRKNI